MKTTEHKKLTKRIARKVLEVVDAGLCKGKGDPIPGQMCVEAAVCYAMGLPHSDQPECVSPAVRSLKIALNDAEWSSNEARAAGLRRLAIAQLGSGGVIDDQEFAKRVALVAVSKIAPRALRHASDLHPQKKHQDALRKAAEECEACQELNAAWSAAAAARSAESAARSAWSTEAAARSAESAARSAWSAEEAARSARSAAKDQELAFFAEEVVQVLIALESPGCKWLDITEGK